MEKFILASLKIFFWISIGILLKFITNKIDILKNKLTKIIDFFSGLIMIFIVPYFVGINIWLNGISKKIFFPILILLLFIMSVTYYFSSVLKKYNLPIKETYLSLTFMNTLYLGIPVTEYFISPSAIYYTILYSIIAAILQFTLGIFLISPNIKSLKFILTSPMIYAFMLGYIANVYKIPNLQLLINIKNFISLTLSPTMLIFIGYNIQWKNLTKNIFLHIIINLLRTVIIFILSILFCIIVKNFIFLDDNFIKTLILISILPSAIMNYIILKNLNIDTDFTSGEIVWGTLITLFLLPYLSEFMEIILLTLK
ncbi:MAG: AEC family transporter [Endomicrobiia bacterium]